MTQIDVLSLSLKYIHIYIYHRFTKKIMTLRFNYINLFTSSSLKFQNFNGGVTCISFVPAAHGQPSKPTALGGHREQRPWSPEEDTCYAHDIDILSVHSCSISISIVKSWFQSQSSFAHSCPSFLLTF